MTQSREQPRHPLSHPDSASPSPSPSASFTSVAPRGFNPRPPPIEQPPAQARPLAHHHHHQQQQQQGGSTLYHSPPTPSSPPSSSSSSHPISSAQQRPQIIPFKRSQRPSWSCTECARRKIKCNKQVPCDPCLKRGRGDSCTLAHDEFLIATPAQLKKLEVGGSSPSKQPQTARKEAGVETGVQPETNLDPTLPQNQSPGNNPMTFAGLNSSLNRDSNFYAGFLSPGFLIRELEEINRRLANLEAGSILKRIEEVEKALKNFNRRSLPTLASRDSPRREDDDLAESVGGRGTPPPHPSSLASSDQGSRGDGSVAPRQTKKNTWEAQENSHGADLAANADLEVEDAATTLEFFALGRDRRRVIGEVVEEEHSGQKVHSSGSSRDDDDHDPPLPYESLSSSSSSVAAVRGTKPPRGSSGTYVRERCSSSSSASKGNEDPPKNLLKQAPKKPIPPSIPAALLDMDSVISILEIARDDGAWQHCCVHFPTFDRELAAMLRLEGDDRWTKVDPAWYSLFFVLQSISIHQMTSREAESCGITSSQAHAELPGKLLHAALDCLHHADYLVRPSMYACQAIGILCVCGHNVAGSDLLNSLLAVGIKTAQTLNLHGLGKVSKQLANLASSRSAREAEANKDDHNQDLGWRRRIVEVELGKRVWWALTQQDYFAIPFRGVYSVFAGQYDTPFPSNCHDEDLEKGLLIERPIHVLTVSTKQKFTSQMAKLICDFFEELNRKKICP
ncbi:hypothetical protein IE53DRAFT_380047 [Violaceomyces palustris]|uniref:Uncharacterized protein n=1 Tax=Violaceomyces palustris TaxID=1673888 RepID=A0ACD0NWC1_9BASI|nr:hypothetical protein IE53DRAFT_380047 [Violaceomyces palustris]